MMRLRHPDVFSRDFEPFFRTKDQAFEADQRDQEQLVVETILSYRRDHKKRTLMVFKV